MRSASCAGVRRPNQDDESFKRELALATERRQVQRLLTIAAGFLFGIVFGTGAGDPFRCPSPSGPGCARGMLPSATGIYAQVEVMRRQSNRYTHTQELLISPYRALFQTNSWGSCLDPEYTAEAFELDDIALLNNLVILHSAGNEGPGNLRCEGGPRHLRIHVCHMFAEHGRLPDGIDPPEVHAGPVTENAQHDRPSMQLGATT